MSLLKLHLIPLLVLLAVQLLYSKEAVEERDNFRIERLSLEEGVAHNMVFAIVQDKRGFMWIGTMLGLIKYDGAKYTIYRTSPEDQNTLSNDDITEIIEDNDEQLWIGTYSGGLNIYDKDKGVFTRLNVDFFDLKGKWNGMVWSLAEDNFGNIWVGTYEAGIIKINKKTLKYKFYKNNPEDENSISINAISKIISDADGTVWVGSNDGILHKYNPETDNFTRLNKIDNGRKATFAVITEIFEGSENILWVGTERGLYVFDKTIEKYRSKGEKEFSAFTGQLVNCVYEDKSGKIWIGSTNGLHVFNKSLEKLAHFMHNEIDPHSLSSNIVVDVYEDMSGVVWVGNYLGGVDKVYVNQDKFNLYRRNPNASNTFSDNHIFGMAEDKDRNIWLATNNGLNKFNKKENKVEVFTYHDNRRSVVSSNQIRAVAVDENNDLWIGTTQGLDKYDLVSGIARHYTNNYLNRLSLSDNVITTILIDSKKTMWVGTFRGLNKFYPSSDMFIRYLPSLFEPSTNSERISALFEDSEKNLWVGTYRGLFRKSPTSEEFVSFRHEQSDNTTLSHNYVFAIHQDSEGVLWIGTGGGLNKFDKETETFTYFDESDGLPDRVIRGILEDDNGLLYLSTNKGISRFDPDKNKFYNYDIGDGLQSNMFVEGAFLKRKNGEMLFGGINGFNSFFPSKLKPKSFVPPIYITSVKRFDEELVFDKEITTVKEIVLDYSDNFITFEFAALDYVNPSKIDYAYMLTGIDNDWVYSGNNAKASYTNLPPGDYMFQVKATNSDKVWSDEILELTLIITPPFWRTWQFNLLLIAAFVIIFYLIYKMKVDSELKKAREIEEIRVQENEKVRKKAADDFHDELGHRLTKISLYAEIMKRGSKNTEDKNNEYLERISEITKGLSTGVRDFIWTLDPGKDTLHETAIRLKDFGDDLFDGSGIAFRVSGISKSFEKIKLSMDWRRQITLSFKEAMNNVLKYARCSNVEIKFQLDGENLQITLKDDGAGFDIVKESKGRGLRNMQSRADNIKGKIDIVSEIGHGTTVIFNGKITV